MTLLALVIVPALGAALAYVLRSARGAVRVLIGAALLHTALVGRSCGCARRCRRSAGGSSPTPLGRVVLTLVSVLFLAVAHYAVGLPATTRRAARGGRAFVSCMLAFLAAASLVALSHHLALLWIGMETTTLAVAPLVVRPPRPAITRGGVEVPRALVGRDRVRAAGHVSARDRAAERCAGRAPARAGRHDRARPRCSIRRGCAWRSCSSLIGFGTKMGLAPMHAWKPDTYGEAPSLVAALMAGALTSCAFLGVARVTSICFAAGLDSFVRPIAPRVRPRVAGHCCRLHRRAGRRQASARLLERRAHGPSRARPRTRWRRRVRRGASRAEQRPRQGVHVPRRRQHRARDGNVGRERDSRRAAHAAGDGAAAHRGVVRGHRVAAVRSLHQRIHDPDRGGRDGPPMDRRRDDSLSRRSSSSASRR